MPHLLTTFLLARKIALRKIQKLERLEAELQAQNYENNFEKIESCRIAINRCKKNLEIIEISLELNKNRPNIFIDL
jgi:hypothetical protein